MARALITATIFVGAVLISLGVVVFLEAIKAAFGVAIALIVALIIAIFICWHASNIIK